MPSSTMRNATDSYTDGANPAESYGDRAVVRVRSADRFAWLYFNRPFPLGSTVKTATLRLFYADAFTGSRVLTARRVDSSWKVSRLRHNNKPGVIGASATATAAAGAAGAYVDIDVTTLLQEVAAGGIWHGLRIASDDATSRSFVSTQGASARRPTLTVEWTDAPLAPTTLRPSASNAVSTSKPTLSFDFTDTLGDTALAAVQVQIDAAADFVTPDFDSGEVATSVAELDLDSTAYAGLANNAETSWRVRVKDAAGLWSQWSDDESFKRIDLGTLAITNPPSVSPVVTEPSPPITWTYDATQAAWRVIVVDGTDPSIVLADSLRQTGTETSWSLPSATLTTDGPYVVTVRVWDDNAREATPDALDYAVASRTFTMTTDAAVTAVSDLTATQPDADKPVVELTWTRGTAPDGYVVLRDGIVIDDDVLPADVLVSGTDNRYVDDSARAWASHTWRVRAIVNGAQSSSAAVSATPKTRGIWLFDKQRELEVWLAGDDGGSWALGEEATVFAPIGAKSVVRRVQSQRGYEGQLSGVLVDRGSLTAQESEAALDEMRNDPGRVVTLTLADLALRVILGNVTIYPTTTTPPVRRVSFDFWEVRQ